MKAWPPRKAYLERLAPRAAGRIVVCYLGATSNLWAKVCPQPSNLFLPDFMGLPIPLALGIAVARPEKSVIAMEGDGSLIMKLEALITAGAQAPPNLLVLTFYNGAYVSGGGQPLPGEINLEDFAKAARFPQTATVDSPEAFEAALDRMLDSGRLGFISLLTARDTEADLDSRDRPRPLEVRADFTRWVKEKS